MLDIALHHSFCRAWRCRAVELQANFYHCAAYGTPITNNLGGPDPTGCTMGAYSDAVHNLFVELAMDEMDHVTGIQTYLGRCIEFSCPISADTLVCCWDYTCSQSSQLPCCQQLCTDWSNSKYHTLQAQQLLLSPRLTCQQSQQLPTLLLVRLCHPHSLTKPTTSPASYPLSCLRMLV